MKAVKICGLKRWEDVEVLNRVKPEYAGFVFAQGKRQVHPIEDRYLAEGLEPGIQRVGVFVNESLDTIHRIVKEWNLDIVQLHGHESEAYVRRLQMPVWKAFSISSKEDLVRAQDFDARGILLDAGDPKVYGGTGRRFDWALLDLIDPEECQGEMGKDRLWILAGGLTVENVGEGCQIPFVQVLDVSSGVETDGRKDPTKIQKFVEKVRSYSDGPKEKQ